MSKANDTQKTCRITTKSMEFEPHIKDAHGVSQTIPRMYKVNFVIDSIDEHPSRTFEIPVWISAEKVNVDDVLRAARHQLHLDLDRLASMSKVLRIPDDELGTVFRAS